MRYAVLTVAALAAACSDLRPRGLDLPPEMDHSALAPVALTGQVLTSDSALGLPGRIEVVGRNVVVVDQAADSIIHVLDRTDGNLIRSFGRRGGGPGEYQGVWSVAAVPGSDDEFWIWDVGSRRLTHVDLGEDFVDGGGPGERSVNVAAEVPILDPVLVEDRWVAVGFMEEGRFAFLDHDGNMVGTGGALPPGDDELPASVRQQVNQSSLAAKPDRSLLAVVTRHFDRLEIYRPDGTLVVSRTGPFDIQPEYEVRMAEGRRPGIASGGDLRFGYVGVAATDDRIYALFSGRVRAGFPPGEAVYAEYVHVYDWEGTLLGALKLDAPSLSLAVDPAGEALYALRYDPVPAVVRYPLGEVFTEGAAVAAVPGVERGDD